MTTCEPSPETKDEIRRMASAFGFDEIGFAKAEATEHTAFLRSWVERGFAGEMHYLTRRLEERVDPKRVLPEAKTLIVVATFQPEDGPTPAPAPLAAPPSTGQVARYAGGDDYHDVLLDRLRALENAIAIRADRPIHSRSYVDTGPISERAAAREAGLGWIGKNSCLIHPEWGSHLMLGVILTELELDPDETLDDHCGTCRACLDVCPTDAFAEPYILDATRCISYTTIESDKGVPGALRAGQGDHVFGCDLCQTICPWNKSRPKTLPADPLGIRMQLSKRPEWIRPSLEWLLQLDEAAFLSASRKTALRRAGWRGLMRNTLIAAGNSGDMRLLPAVTAFLTHSDAMLQEHADWAHAQIVQSCQTPPSDLGASKQP